MVLKRYSLEGIAKILIALGLLLLAISWILGVYYFDSTGKSATLIVPTIFTLVIVLLLLVIKYRYTLFEKYPYLMNLPSLFYKIGKQKDSNAQGIAFNMIFTIHALIIAFIGLLSMVLAISVGLSIYSKTASPFVYIYLAIVAILVAVVLLQYRRIYIKFS
ncbi:MAG: hypothetical protein QXD11_03160 [Candidatus Micrarchaeaceae archaeon]